jgi:hypothetical protein
MHRDAELPHVVLAGTSPRRLASRLDRRKQQRNQNPDNGNYDEEFDEGEAIFAIHGDPSQIYGGEK